MLLRIVQARHQIGERLAAPVAIHAIDKCLPIPGRPTRIDHDHDIPVRRKQLRIPPVRPRVAPRPLRPPMNQKLHRILLRRIKPRRPNDEALLLRPIPRLKPEVLHLRQIKLIQQRIVEVGQLCFADRRVLEKRRVDRARLWGFCACLDFKRRDLPGVHDNYFGAAEIRSFLSQQSQVRKCPQPDVESHTLPSPQSSITVPSFAEATINGLSP